MSWLEVVSQHFPGRLLVAEAAPGISHASPIEIVIRGVGCEVCYQLARSDSAGVCNTIEVLCNSFHDLPVDIVQDELESHV